MYSKRKQYVGIDRAQGRIQLFKKGGQTSKKLWFSGKSSERNFLRN